jgi:predicted MFS family arabinose efflux permease
VTVAAPGERQAGTAWAPFGHPTFVVLWTATVVSNVGTWMGDVGAGWLMTELSPSPLVVAAVQAATTLPIFLFALVAGALADIMDRRRLLIVVNAALAVAAALLAALVAAGLMTPALLLAFTFAFGTGAAFIAPAWQAIVPQLVPRAELQGAIALNSMGINIARAIGPALAGALIVSVGLAAPFAANAISTIGIVLALWWWRPPERPAATLPPERVGGAIVAGVRYALHSRPLLDTLARAAAFFLFASAYWAMLPLLVRDVLLGGPTLYGVLLGCVGAGAVAGALVLPAVRRRLGPDRTVAAGTLGTAAAMAGFAGLAEPVVAALASLLAGLSWIAVLSSLNVSAQTALPDWVRARGLSVFLTVFFGSMAAGSMAWGKVAASLSIPAALLIAAAGAVLAIPLVRRFRLNTGAEMELAPSMHWPAPLTTAAPEHAPRHTHGPVMVQVSYRVPSARGEEFAGLMRELGAARRRGGGFGWSLMRDAAEPERFVETWFEQSWAQHLRHHERVSGEDRALQERIAAIHAGEAAPQVRHFLPP